MGRPFITASTSHMRVSNPSSFRTCSLRGAFRILGVVLIHRSQMPPWCDAAGELKIQRTFCCNKYSRIRCLFHFWIQVRNSFSPLTKLVPSSVLTNTGFCLLAMKWWRAFIKESVSSECAISMWTALIVRHVKIQPYLFGWPLPCFTINGPKKSIPTWLNGGCHREHGPQEDLPSFDYTPTGASRRLQLIQLPRTLRTTELARITRPPPPG